MRSLTCRRLAPCRSPLGVVLVLALSMFATRSISANTESGNGLDRLARLVDENPEEAPLRWAFATALAEAGDLEAATRELVHYESRWPERRDDVPLQLGRWLYEQGDYPEARRALGRALARDPKSGPAHLYMGLVLSRVGESRTAAAQFSLAAELAPSLAPDAGLLGGLALLNANQEAAGLALLREVIERYPDSEPARYARLVLGERAADGDERFRAEIYAGIEFDSNVTLTDGDIISGRSADQKDGAGSWGANLSARVWQNDRFSFRLGSRYDRLQHFELDDFDTHSISGYGSAKWKVSPRVRLRLDARVGWTTLGGDPYALTGTIRPTVAIAVGDRIGVSRIYAEVAPIDFDEETLFPSLKRDGIYYTGSFEHLWPIPGLQQSWLSLGVLYSRLESTGTRDLLRFRSAFDHHRWRTSTALQAPLPGQFVLDLRVNVSGEHYDNRNVIALLTNFLSRAPKRKDMIYEVGLRVARPMTAFVDVEMTWRFTHRDSNVAIYSYDRHVVGLQLRVHPIRWIQGGNPR